MGLFDSLVGTAAKSAGISMRKSKIKKEVDAMRQRADVELRQHNTAFSKILEGERGEYLARRKHFLITYSFAQIMLGQNIGGRDFTFLDQLPHEYREDKCFKKKLEEVENEYYSLIANSLKNADINISIAIFMLRDLLSIKEIKDEVQPIISAEQFIENEMTSSASIFTDCEDIGAKMTEIQNFNFLDALPIINDFSDGLTEFESGNYKGALKHWLFGDYQKTDFDKMKIALLHFAQDKNQDESTVGMNAIYKMMCRLTFSLSVIKEVNNEEIPVLYPSVDMVIAEILRHIDSGTVNQYNETLKDWLDVCGNQIDYRQINVLQKVFSYLNVFEQEAIILEYMVSKNMPRTPEQNQRLKFLKSSNTRNVISTSTFLAPNVQVSSGELLYDHRFVSWKINEIQQYFNNLTLTNTTQTFKMVIDEWNKDIEIQGIQWNIDQVMVLITSGIEKNFGDIYDISIIEAGAAVDDWVDVFPSIHIQAKDTSIRNAELSFLVTGEQITNVMIHLSVMILLSPTDRTGSILENDVLCKKVITIKEKHNPRADTFISAMKNILIAQLETWMNQVNNECEIY